MSTPFLKSFDRTVSIARLESYRRLGESDTEVLAKYLWNASVCEALHSSLQHLEVGFRNALHVALVSQTGNANWLSHELGVLQPQEVEGVRAAKKALLDRRSLTDEGHLINELGFGFWASLLDSRYERLWPKIIADVFPKCPRRERTRPDLSRIITSIRRLRNAAFHHHSIWHWKDLSERRQEVHTVLEWICPWLAIVALETDRFPQVLAAGQKMHLPILERILSPPDPLRQPVQPAPHVTFIKPKTDQK